MYLYKGEGMTEKIFCYQTDRPITRWADNQGVYISGILRYSLCVFYFVQILGE